jgi:hypothetical protein
MIVTGKTAMTKTQVTATRIVSPLARNITRQRATPDCGHRRERRLPGGVRLTKAASEEGLIGRRSYPASAFTSVTRLSAGLRPFIVLDVFAQILPHRDPRQIPIRFSSCRLKGGSKIRWVAVSKIKTEKNAPLGANLINNKRVD